MKRMIAVIETDNKRSRRKKSQCAHSTAEDLGPLVESRSLANHEAVVLEELGHQFPEVMTIR